MTLVPVTVEVAFGAAPWDTSWTWTDISAYVRRAPGITMARGWDPESQSPSGGTCTFTVNNETGDFTPGVTGAFGTVRNRLPIRISTTIASGTGTPVAYDSGLYYDVPITYEDTEVGPLVLWSGLVESWQVGWTNGVRSQVRVRAADRWALLKRQKITDERAKPTALAQSPRYFWAMTDPTGSTRATESVAGLDWVPTAGAFTFANAVNPQTGNTTNVVSTQDVALLGGPFIDANATGWSLSAWIWNGNLFTTDLGYPAANAISLENNGAAGYVVLVRHNAVAKTYTHATGATAGWHHLAVTGSLSAGTSTLRFYVDGAQVWTDTLTGGLLIAQSWMVSNATGLGYVGVWPRALTAAEVATQHRAVTLSAWQGDTADVRAQQLAAISGGWPVTTTGSFTSTMSAPALTGKSPADVLAECAAAEGGAVFIGRDGWPVITARSWRTAAAVSLTLPAKALSADVTWTMDDQTLRNAATVERMAGDVVAATVSVRNEDSITEYAEQSTSLQLWLDSDAQALDRANAEAHMFATSAPRSSELAVDLATKAASIDVLALLNADVGQVVAVTGMPSQAPDADEFFIEQVSDQIGVTWTRTMTISPRLDFWTLEHATAGAPDSTFVLAY